MTFEDKQPCPKCGEKTMPKIWNGFYPPICDKCGFQAKQIEVKY